MLLGHGLIRPCRLADHCGCSLYRHLTGIRNLMVSSRKTSESNPDVVEKYLGKDYVKNQKEKNFEKRNVRNETGVNKYSRKLTSSRFGSESWVGHEKRNTWTPEYKRTKWNSTGEGNNKKNSEPLDTSVASAVDPADVFGMESMSPTDLREASLSDSMLDEEDEEEPWRERGDDIPSSNWFGKRMLELIEQRKLADAIDLLEVRMKQDKVKPTNYIYNILITGCGRVGYTKKAFQLYNQMKSRSLKLTGATYTTLFNACSNCPWPQEGLQKAHHLKRQMEETGWLPNTVTYHAMIKAFGRCGDLMTAFQLVDEMATSQHALGDETFNFLLQACISNKEVGLRHALLLWRRLRQRKVKPSIYTYNLLLRAVRDCGIGDSALYDDLLRLASRTKEEFEQKNIPQVMMLEPFSNNHKESGAVTDTCYSQQESEPIMDPIRNHQGSDPRTSKADSDSIEAVKKVRTISQETKSAEADYQENVNTGNKYRKKSVNEWRGRDGDSSHVELTKTDKMSTTNPSLMLYRPTDRENTQAQQLPNLLLMKPTMGTVISIGDMEKPENRLLLLGGVCGLLDQMVQDGVKPDIKTFTQLVGIIPSNRKSEEDLLSAMQKYGVKPDIDFFNILIKKRNFRFDTVGAKYILTLIGKEHLVPDIVTFGVLALGCRTYDDSKQLIEDMNQADMRLNIEILATLMFQAIRRRDCWHLVKLMKISKEEQICPDAYTLQRLEKFKKEVRNHIIDKEKGYNVPEVFYDEYFKKGFEVFSMEYKNWLCQMKVSLPEHPWKQYRNPKEKPEEEKEKNATQLSEGESNKRGRLKEYNIPRKNTTGERRGKTLE